MNPLDIIKSEFYNEELSYLDAIEALQKLGINSLEAEEIVTEWEENRESTR